MTERYLSSLLVFACLLAIATGVPARQLSTDAIDLLLDRSGVEHILESLPLQVDEGLVAVIAEDPEGTALLADSVQTLRESATTIFAPGQLTPVIRQVLVRQMNADQVSEVIDWLESPLGARLTELENATASPEFPQQLEAYLATFPDNQPTTERLELLRELDQAANITESGIEVVLHMQLALVVAVVETLPEQQRPSVTELLRRLESERPSIEQTIKQMSLYSLLYTYREVGDADLRRYIQFLESRTGKVYQSSIIEGLDLALMQAVRRWGSDVGKILQAATQRKRT